MMCRGGKLSEREGRREIREVREDTQSWFSELRLRLPISPLNDHAALACFRVLLAFFAALLREAADRARAAVRACLDSAEWEAADRPFFLSAFDVALDLLAEGL
jgi:hypothetical protein